MSCDFSETSIEFKKSKLSVRPYSIDVRRSRQNSNQFDHVQATLTREAGERIIANNINKEPVEIEIDNFNVLYRGYYLTDNIQLGRNKSTLTIQDPLKILRTGSIDKQWGSITLKNVTEYIFERRQDPHNILSSVDFVTPKFDTEKLQHENAGFGGGGMERTAGEEGSISNGLTNFVKETVPFAKGDGNFDFREESPYSALNEVADIWETRFWVDRDGTLVIGHPDINATVYGAGRGLNNWQITEWNLPENPTPLKAVVVKGKADQKGGKDNAAEELWNIVTNKKKYQTRAAAGFLDDDSLSEVVMLDGKKETTDPKALKQMAKSAFLERYTQNNKGSVVINADVENNIPVGQYADVNIGDKLLVNNIDLNCENLKAGLYDIHSIQHEITGDNGWSITLDLNEAIADANGFKSKFWYFDPTDEDMTEPEEPGTTFGIAP